MASTSRDISVRPKSRACELDRLSTTDLLAMKFCDLPIALSGSSVERRAVQVFTELETRGIAVRPSIWLAEEWFNPDGVTGFAIPFYLVHPRLVRLERHLMLEAEGVKEGECLRILRHETGHAIDEAFQLFRTPEYRRVFGSPRRPYPTSYAVRPTSRDHVHHLNAWYAQAHPVEDFAETFAVWLRPNNLWHRRYRDWPALDKLAAVDRWMHERSGRRPEVENHSPVDLLSENSRTLAQHYDEKRSFYRIGSSHALDRRLLRIFPKPTTDLPARKSAVGILRTIRTPLRKAVGRPLGVPAYAVDQVLRQIIQRAKALDLRHTRTTEATIKDISRLVARVTNEMISTAPRLPL